MAEAELPEEERWRQRRIKARRTALVVAAFALGIYIYSMYSVLR